MALFACASEEPAGGDPEPSLPAELLSEAEVQCVDDVCDIKEERMYHRLLDGKMEEDVF